MRKYIAALLAMTLMFLSGCKMLEGISPETLEKLAELAQSGASSQAQQGETLGGHPAVRGFVSPKELPEGMELRDAVTVEEIAPWSYFVCTADYQGKEYAVLARDVPEGTAEILFAAEQEGQENMLGVEYIAGSFDQSGGTRLYFQLSANAGQHWLYGFSPEEERCELILGGVCSNMVLFEEPLEGYESMGWVLQEDAFVPVDLARGQADGSAIRTLGDLGGVPELSDHFFAGIGAGYDTKFPILSAAGDGLLGVEVIQLDSQTSQPESRLYYRYDFTAAQLWAVDSTDAAAGTGGIVQGAPENWEETWPLIEGWWNAAERQFAVFQEENGVRSFAVGLWETDGHRGFGEIILAQPGKREMEYVLTIRYPAVPANEMNDALPEETILVILDASGLDQDGKIQLRG
ncbi:MAG: hypothetical protein PHD67_02610 [Oscillospiraceae bacterium]|nr:hypothetical protein [Oscillospiraceae bacterium]